MILLFLSCVKVIGEQKLSRKINSLKITRRKETIKLPILENCIFHSNLKLLMTIKNKSIATLAEEADVDEFTVKKARTSRLMRTCRLESLDKIAEVLKKSKIFSVL